MAFDPIEIDGETGAAKPAGQITAFGRDTRFVDVIATADADTAVVITHGLGSIPTDIVLTPLGAAYYVSKWYVSAATVNTLTLTKSTDAGSGAPGAQVRATIRRQTHLNA